MFNKIFDIVTWITAISWMITTIIFIVTIIGATFYLDSDSAEAMLFIVEILLYSLGISLCLSVIYLILKYFYKRINNRYDF